MNYLFLELVYESFEFLSLKTLLNAEAKLILFQFFNRSRTSTGVRLSIQFLSNDGSFQFYQSTATPKIAATSSLCTLIFLVFTLVGSLCWWSNELSSEIREVQLDKLLEYRKKVTSLTIRHECYYLIIYFIRCPRIRVRSTARNEWEFIQLNWTKNNRQSSLCKVGTYLLTLRIICTILFRRYIQYVYYGLRL